MEPISPISKVKIGVIGSEKRDYRNLWWAPLSTSELLDEQPERRRLTVVFVCDPLREFFGTTAYRLGVAVALPMLKGVCLRGNAHVQTIEQKRRPTV